MVDIVNGTFRSLGTDSTAWSRQKNGAQIFSHFFVKVTQILQVDLNSPTKEAFYVS